jgi:hypothetical protein
MGQTCLKETCHPSDIHEIIVDGSVWQVKKREYIVLLLIIAALSIYLAVQKRGEVHYVLPELEKIEKADVSRLLINSGSASLTLKRDGEEWSVMPGGYPADVSLVDRMLAEVGGLTLTALVSESKSYDVYDLDEDNRIEVGAYGGEGKAIRKFAVGKAASSYRHTFVTVGDGHEIYHARGSIRSVFDKTVASLRDRSVMSFDERINEVTVSDGGNGTAFVRSSVPVEVNVNREQAEETGGEPKDTWVTDKGRPVKGEDLDDVIKTIQKLKCDYFIEGRGKGDLGNPGYEVSLRGAKTYTLSLFEKEGDKYAATSSESAYPFVISERKADRIMKGLAGLTDKE